MGLTTSDGVVTDHIDLVDGAAPVAPQNMTRIRRNAGALEKSSDGGAYNDIGSGSFSSDTLLRLLNSTPALYDAIRLIAATVVSTPGAEEAAWDITAAKAGVLATLASFGFDLNTFPMLFIGSRAGRSGIRLNGAATELVHGGTAVISTTGTTATFPSFNVQVTNRLITTRAAGSVSVNTLTLGTAVTTTVAGAPTINGIVTTGKTPGERVLIELLNGATLVNASGAPGASAADLKLVGAANIVVGAQGRSVPFEWNGTFWFQEG